MPLIYEKMTLYNFAQTKTRLVSGFFSGSLITIH